MASKNFEEIFGFAPEASASAPGRVNLLGEHTDYNDGFVLPVAIPQRTWVTLSRSRDDKNHFYSSQLNKLVACNMDDEFPAGFSRYVLGCLRLLRQAGFDISNICLFIRSDVPMGAGLSSSAALEVAVLRGMRELFGLKIDDVEIALMAQKAEIQYAGVKCGIMDQMAASLADTGKMLFLDTRTLERKLLSLPESSRLLVVDSGVPRSLSTSNYNLRREECEEAARLLGVKALRDVIDDTATEILPPVLARRARHVIRENARVIEASHGVNSSRFGELMNDSHTSLRDDFEVSVPPLDLLVQLLQECPGVFGARLTGAGFGGACIALTEEGAAEVVTQRVLPAYQRAGHAGKILVN